MASMNLKHLLRLIALSVFAILMFGGPAGAETTLSELVAFQQSDDVGVESIEVGLVGLFPLVILVSSFLLGPEASEPLKKALPLIVGVLVSALYFALNTWPEPSANLLVSVSALIAFASKLYDPISSVIKLIGPGRSLNDLTGPGVLGRNNDERR